MKQKVALIVLGLTLMALTACSTASPDAAVPSTSEPVPAASAKNAPLPTIAITSPTDGATIEGGTVEVTVETSNLEFTMPSNTKVAGQGHVHFTLDDQAEQMSTEPSYTFEGVAPGTHQVRAEVVQNDTTKFDPPIAQEITVVVK